MTATANRAPRTPSQRHFLTPSGTIAIYAGGSDHTLVITLYPNSAGREVVTAKIVSSDTRVVALAVCAGTMTKGVLADWLEDRRFPAVAYQLRHQEMVDKW